jgi:hypothetical protein
MASTKYLLGIVILFQISEKYFVTSKTAACKHQVVDCSLELKYK